MNSPISTLRQQMTSKHLQIDKAQSTMLVATAVATAITVFSLISAKTLLSEARFQSHVISARHAAAKQLQDNAGAARQLADQYSQVFIGTGSTNVIGGENQNTEVINGQRVTTQPPAGDNGRIVLDALPTAYDYPALLTSLSKLLAQDGIGSPTINGSDQSQSVKNQSSSRPEINTIDIPIGGAASYSAMQTFISDLEHSVRPFDITQLTLNGNNSSMTISVDLTTYYQPAKTLNLSTKEIH